MKKLNKATVLIIASMLVLALTLVATFSWFLRASDYASTNYHTINLNPAKVYIKAAPESVKTYLCDLVNGLVDDANKKKVTLTENNTFTINPKECKYFKTIVTDKVTANNNLSLTGLTLTGTTTDIKVCSLSPLKTTQSYRAGIAIAEHIVTTAANQGAVVEWYLYNSGDAPQSITISQLPAASITE